MDTYEKVNLRPYQELAVSDLLMAIDNKVNTILQLPTGTGKTTVIAELVRRWRRVNQNSRALILVHRIELIDQVVARLFEFGIVAGRIKAGEKLDPNYQIQVGLVQSLKNDKRKPLTLGLIIVDEAHHITANSYQDIIQYYDNYKPVILGVTATPSRLDGAPLGDTFESLLQYGQLIKFVEDGYLAPMRHFATGSPELSKVHVKNTGDYDEKMLYSAMNSDLVMADIIKGYELHAKNKKSIVFAVNTEHAQDIANRFNEKGYKAVALDYKTDAQDRKDLVDQFKRGEIQILCNVNLFTEGFDCPDVEVVQLARPTKSLNLYLQMIGRGMRVYPGKEYGIILDNAMLWEEHGLTTRFRKWTLEGLDKSSKNRIKVGVKSEANESGESQIETPKESSHLELIEIIEDVDYGENEKLLKILVLPDVINNINHSLSGMFLFSDSLKISPSEFFYRHSITGQKISTEKFCDIINIQLKSDQKSISKKKFVSKWNEFIKTVEFNIIHTCYNFIVIWKKSQKFIRLNRNREIELNEAEVTELLNLFHTEKAYRFLNISADFLDNIINTINLEQVDFLYQRVIDVHYDKILNKIGNSDILEFIPPPKITLQVENRIEWQDSQNQTFKKEENDELKPEYRIAKVAKELNLSVQTLIDILIKNGYDIADARPTTKITAEMHKTLQRETQKIKNAQTKESSFQERKIISVASELKVNYIKAAKFLNKNGFKIKIDPFSRINEKMYNLLVQEFQNAEP